MQYFVCILIWIKLLIIIVLNVGKNILERMNYIIENFTVNQ